MTCRQLFPVRQAAAGFCAVAVILGWCHSAQMVRAAEQPCCSHCGADGCPMVECTVMVPMTVTETRVKNCIVKKHVDREETYTVFRRVPEKREFKKELCYLDDEVKSQEIEKKTCHIVMNPVIQTYRVKVPVCEEQTEMVETQRCIDGQMVVVEEPCTQQVIREREEVRTQNCERPQVVYETTKCTIDYCVKTPKKYEVPCMEETEYKLVPETRTRKVTACVPTIERQPYDIQVTKMFPETVLCCQPCAAKLGAHGHEGGSKHSKGIVKGAMDNLKSAIHH